MFETVPIENSIADMAQKFKEILGKIFAPVKEAWDREGQFVMDSWKYALDEVWNLMKDIGRDFLTMWNQEATIQMFADILHIIGDIGQVVGNLAHNLDEAWKYSEASLLFFPGYLQGTGKKHGKGSGRYSKECSILLLRLQRVRSISSQVW
jgi:hypothetical protein